MIKAPSIRPVQFERPADFFDLASARRDRVRFVHVPERPYLAVDGTEPPGGEVYTNAIASLYPVAYSLHFGLKRRGVAAGRIGALEGLYWLKPEEELAGDTGLWQEDQHWRWRLLLPITPQASEVDVESAIREAQERRPLRALARLHVLHWEEGPAAQILHVGSYAAETPTIQRLYAEIVAAGYEPHGQHHEIYLNNPQQVGEENARTVVRRPVRPRVEG